ncbi:putative signal transduction protein with EAL and GGDEF domain [Devosia sp. UYZn731]|uniref:putative bifunctional diguanylate cyclase/phosphodiesterase n=1 Tax=Devosia sp. UYZn731 TaxID=3156345 RepID=UPI0033919F4F
MKSRDNALASSAAEYFSRQESEAVPRRTTSDGSTNWKHANSALEGSGSGIENSSNFSANGNGNGRCEDGDGRGRSNGGQVVRPLAVRHWNAISGGVIAFACVFVVWVASLLGGLAPIDQAIRTWRFQATDRAPSGETLFVDIDSKSLTNVGVWPWPRQVHAAILDRLMSLGAAEVVFDIDFSSASTPQGDLALEQALQRAGGYAFLAAFQQTTSAGEIVLNGPLPRFAAQANSVLVNVDGDGTSLLQSVPTGLPELGIPSVAQALVPAAPASGPTLMMDFGIDLERIARISASEVLSGTPDPALFANKQVIVGASAIELRDFFQVPRFGVIPGPLVQLEATETLKAGRLLTDLGSLPALLLSLLAAGAFVQARRRQTPLGVLAAAGAGFIVLVEILAWLALREKGAVLATALFQFSIGLLVLSGLLNERALRWREFLRQQGRLAYLATHDLSSGAISRQALVDALDSELTSGKPASVVLVHLGRLDAAIASLGHDVGEQAAAHVAQRLEQHLAIKPARIGSDLFAWSRPDALNPEQLTALCRWIASALDQPYLIDGHVIILDTRYGATAVSNGDYSAAELLRQSDVALGEARIQNAKALAFSADQSERITQRRLKDIALRQALERDEFYLLFQPQIDLATNRLVGVEALVRWKNAELGAISPADFIPLAEETGLIVRLGDWIMHEACRQVALWSWDGRLSINVSSVQFQLGDVIASLTSALSKSGFPARRLDLEITESLFIKDDPSILGALETIRRMGVSIALDDFGTGYSSLSYLTRLPIDKLKIDQAFVRPLPDTHNEAIVETIILMAKRLGKTVVAEGVETAHQRDYLAALGCEIGQGYLFGRPSSPEVLGLEPSSHEVAAAPATPAGPAASAES